MQGKSRMRRVGILGGMGPGATVLLMQKVIAATPARDDADHVPLIVDQNPQVPSRIRRLIEGTGDDPAPVLAAMARRLEAAGAEALAMPCNTAHHYAPAIRAAAGIPLIDMVALSVTRAAELAGRGGSVGILASPAVRKIGLFDRALAGAGLVAVYPQDEEAMLAAIREIKAEGVTSMARGALAAASRDLLARGAKVQMIACTEFSLVGNPLVPGVQAFDTLDLLVDGIIAFATSNGANDDKAAKRPPTNSANVQDSKPNKETTP
jgi:aspartate racemase